MIVFKFNLKFEKKETQYKKNYFKSTFATFVFYIVCKTFCMEKLLS